MKKASSIETLIQGSELLKKIEEKAASLENKQQDVKQSLNKQLSSYVFIDSINFEEKKIYCIKKRNFHTHKIKGRVVAVLAKEVGGDVCQWQIKISGEK